MMTTVEHTASRWAVEQRERICDVRRQVIRLVEPCVEHQPCRDPDCIRARTEVALDRMRALWREIALEVDRERAARVRDTA